MTIQKSLLRAIGWGALFLSPLSSVIASTTWSVSEGLPHPMVSAIDQKDQWLWVGTKKGVAARGPGQKRFQSWPEMTEPVTALVALGDHAWVGSEKGLFFINGHNGARSQAASLVDTGKIWSLLFDQQQNLWLGSDRRLALLTSGQTHWQTISLPEDAHGPVRDIHLSGSLLYLLAGGSDLLILDLESRRWLRRTPPQTDWTFTSLTLHGKDIFLGTDGQGIMHFDWLNNTWKKIYPKTKVNIFVQTAASNGIHGWFGTFDGLLKLDHVTSQCQPIALGQPEGAITSLAVKGTELFIGTEFGLTIAPLDLPVVTCELEKSILLSPSKQIHFHGLATAQSGIRSLKAEFAVASVPAVWFNQYLSLQGPDGQGNIQGIWGVSDLPNPSDLYLLKVQATDQKNQTNEAITVAIIAPQTPKVELDAMPGPIAPGLQTISGKFDTPFVASVRLKPAGVLAKLDLQAGTFSGTLKLMSGDNPIQAELIDWFGRQPSTQTKINTAKNAAEPGVEVQASAKNEETIILNERLLFDTGSDVIKPSGRPALEKVINYFNQDQRLVAVVEGHTDTIPINTVQFPNNQALSLARARAVFEYLVQQKVSPDRFTIQGLGDKKPIASNATSQGRAKNRRVEIILKKRPMANPKTPSSTLP